MHANQRPSLYGALDVLKDTISEHDSVLDCPLKSYVGVDSGGKVDVDIGEGKVGLHRRSLTQRPTGRRFLPGSCDRGHR